MLTHHFAAPTPPKRVVVIGAGGMVGGAIAKALEEAEIPVAALTRKEVDLLAPDASERLASHLEGGDSVVFVSAVAPTKTTAQLLANLRMAEAACQAFAAAVPAHLVYISSDAIYADDTNPVTERSPAAPSTMHGLMHAARELVFRSEYKGPLACLRPTLIYGASDPHAGYGPNRFRRQAFKGEPITLFGEGEEKRDHVAVEDVARLARLILLHRSAGALNAVTGVSVAFSEVARLVAANFTPPAVVTCQPRPGPRPHLLHRFFDIGDCYKAFPAFHFESLAGGLARIHREILAASGQPSPSTNPN